MKAHFGAVIPLCLLLTPLTFTASSTAAAQDQSQQPTGPSKYLYITNDIVRPGQANDFYKAEANDVQALRAAHAPSHYIAAVPISGSNDVVFIHGFDSFDELQKNHDQTMAMTQLVSTLRTNGATEAPMLSDHYTSIYTYRPELSLPKGKVEDARFLEVTVYHIAPGHHRDFESIAKVFMKALENNPNANWATFEKMYGHDSDDTFAVISLMKSLSDVDQEIADNAKLPDAMGKDQMQLTMEMGSNVIKSSEQDLFAINPQISYVPDKWVSDSPDYWGKK